MFDLFSTFIDTFIQYAKTKDQRHKSFFADVYKPLMAELEKIHLDYISTFNLCLSFVNQDDFTQKVLETIEEKRIPLLPARLKLREYAWTIEKNRYELTEEEVEFSKKLLEYFGLKFRNQTEYTRTTLLMLLLNDQNKEFPIETKAEAEAFLDLQEDEPTFTSYAKTKYITDVRTINLKRRRKIAVSFLNDQIKSLNFRWSMVCGAFSKLEYKVSRHGSGFFDH